MVQGCPVEVLDHIFEYTIYLDPENAQATLCSLMLTCSHFRTIAKRHFIRIVCLPNAEKINVFASYLKQMVESGDYGKGRLPIHHLAVMGKYRIPQGLSFRRLSDAEAEAERIVPFIITTAAPSLLTLTIFGVDIFGADTDFVNVDTREDFHNEVPLVPKVTTFPKLRDLIALEQHVIPVMLLDDNGNPDKRACQLKYPSLRRLYIPGYVGLSLPSALPYLEHLRLEMLDQEYDGPPREGVAHVRSLIIDAPRYSPYILAGCIGYPQSRDEYDSKISKCQTLIDEVGNSERSGIVIPADGFTQYVDRGRILSAWVDTVVGALGCWATGWVPTTPYSGRYKI